MSPEFSVTRLVVILNEVKDLLLNGKGYQSPLLLQRSRGIQ